MARRSSIIAERAKGSWRRLTAIMRAVSLSGASARGSGRGRRGTSEANTSRRAGRSAHPQRVMSSRKFRRVSTEPCTTDADTR